MEMEKFALTTNWQEWIINLVYYVTKKSIIYDFIVNYHNFLQHRRTSSPTVSNEKRFFLSRFERTKENLINLFDGKEKRLC